MLQSARKPHSKSLLRDLEYSLVLIENNKDRQYFLQELKEVYQKQKEQPLKHSGAKKLKSELLYYLKQQDSIQTANIWARNLTMDKAEIKQLLEILQYKLSYNKIQGILELHLQDREINSPHFQFVGNQAEQAEQIIAQTLVQMNYELNMENALSKKNYKPYYTENEQASTNTLNIIKEAKTQRQEEQWQKNLESLEIKFQNIQAKIQQNLTNIKSIERTTDRLKRIRHRQRLRRKRR